MTREDRVKAWSAGSIQAYASRTSSVRTSRVGRRVSAFEIVVSQTVTAATRVGSVFHSVTRLTRSMGRASQETILIQRQPRMPARSLKLMQAHHLI